MVGEPKTSPTTPCLLFVQTTLALGVGGPAAQGAWYNHWLQHVVACGCMWLHWLQGGPHGTTMGTLATSQRPCHMTWGPLHQVVACSPNSLYLMHERRGAPTLLFLGYKLKPINAKAFAQVHHGALEPWWACHLNKPTKGM
jgi:hypothetical protein